MSTQITPKQAFHQKLRLALDRKQVGVTDLARRLVPDETSKEFDATRRAIHKHLKGDAKPRRQMRRRYETALGLEMGELEPDDEESSRMSAIDRSTVADVLIEALQQLKSNAPAAHFAASTARASTTTEVTP